MLNPAAYALDNVMLKFGSIDGGSWQLDGAKLELADPGQATQQLSLIAERLHLPEPLNGLNALNLRCRNFHWKNKSIACEQGRADIQFEQWQAVDTDFSFHISEQKRSFKMSGLRLLAGGTFALEALESDDNWRLRVQAKKLDAVKLRKLLPWQGLELSGGKLDAELTAFGNGTDLQRFALTASLKSWSGQSTDGRFASEDLQLNLAANAEIHGGVWQWRHHAETRGGAIYIDPVYLEPAKAAIELNGEGRWYPEQGRIEIVKADYRHGRAGRLGGSAMIEYGNTVGLTEAELSLQTEDMQMLSNSYLKPFFEQTLLQGVTAAGKLTAELVVHNKAISALTLSFNDLELADAASRGGLEGGSGKICWSADPAYDRPSELAWRQARIRKLPIGPGKLSLLSKDGNIRLLQKARLPFLGGEIVVDHFNWQAKTQQEPDVSFEGALNEVSLEQLSKALDWPPLSGIVSGSVPRVEYSNKTLSLGGELIVKVFGGDIKITNLASSGLFTDFCRFYAELEIDNLDLDQLTGRFEFGGITGKLSGYVKQLYLENWQPVSFFAWFGTPEDDDSRHRISQQAVKNIAEIGGGGAADVVSRSFLRFFDTFGYDKLGLGCYLHDGVCQLMGVEAVDSGYAIVTGGGLPRIDVIGYNSRVDWQVLLERLQRITSLDAAVVE